LDCGCGPDQDLNFFSLTLQKSCPARVSQNRIGQNPDIKEFRSQNIESKELRTGDLKFTDPLWTVTASTMITDLDFARKVRCHTTLWKLGFIMVECRTFLVVDEGSSIFR
jgi:hypothetical protein